VTDTPAFALEASPAERRKSWLLMAGLWLLLLVLAALRPLAVPDEGRYGEVGRWMLQSGDWLTPRLNGIPFFHKPPLVHWLQVLSLSVFGINELALRLVPALHAGLMMVALYLAARRLCGEAVARTAALMLGCSLAFLFGGQYVNHDMAVATWIGVAIWCFAFSFMAGDKPDAALARWGFVACALGMLSKLMIGFVLPGLVMFVWLLWTRQFKKVLYLPWVSGLALFLLIASPWFVLEQGAFPGFLHYVFVEQQFNRATGQNFNNANPWYYYVVMLAGLLFPWAFFALRQARRDRAQADASPLSQDAWRLCWVWILAILVFFSSFTSKLIGYIFPVLPALALLAALGWRQVVDRRWPRAAGPVFALVCILNVVAGVVGNVYAPRVVEDRRAEDVAKRLACEASPGDTVYVTGSDYPYELPFYAQLDKPMVVVQDWVRQRKEAGDDWRRELFDGTGFDAKAAQVLQQPEALAPAAQQPGNWLLVRHGGMGGKDKDREQEAQQPLAQGWKLVMRGTGFNLFTSSGAGVTPGEGPKPAEHKGLPGCKHQGDK
jgi:4-amino-4-deoxy-L-arabinose transferase-like glycosyltransferase